jgi:hypothetical protein
VAKKLVKAVKAVKAAKPVKATKLVKEDKPAATNPYIHSQKQQQRM